MITIAIPGRPELRLHHLVADFNGTLAEGGVLIPAVAERIEALAERIDIHVITADTFAEARRELADLPLDLVVLAGDSQDEQKGTASLNWDRPRWSLPQRAGCA